MNRLRITTVEHSAMDPVTVFFTATTQVDHPSEKRRKTFAKTASTPHQGVLTTCFRTKHRTGTLRRTLFAILFAGPREIKGDTIRERTNRRQRDNKNRTCLIDPRTKNKNSSILLVSFERPLPFGAVGVGTALANDPRTDPSMRNCRTRLLPRVRTSKRTSGNGCATRAGGSHHFARRPIRAQVSHVRWLRRRSASYQLRVTWVRKTATASVSPGTA